jgi:hypothetical protein
MALFVSLGIVDIAAIIPALWRLRQGNFKFKVKQGYVVRPCLKKPK